jgi:hypothetical protein
MEYAMNNHNNAKHFKRTTCQLLIIDLQEKFTPVIPKIDDILLNTAFAIQVANLLHIPITVTEHKPAVCVRPFRRICELVPGFKPLSKMTFQCWRDEIIRGY